MKKRIMNALENFSKAMLQPLMYLSVGGLILAIGALITNSAIAFPEMGAHSDFRKSDVSDDLCDRK